MTSAEESIQAAVAMWAGSASTESLSPTPSQPKPKEAGERAPATAEARTRFVRGVIIGKGGRRGDGASILDQRSTVQAVAEAAREAKLLASTSTDSGKVFEEALERSARQQELMMRAARRRMSSLGCEPLARPSLEKQKQKKKEEEEKPAASAITATSSRKRSATAHTLPPPVSLDSLDIVDLEIEMPKTTGAIRPSLSADDIRPQTTALPCQDSDSASDGGPGQSTNEQVSGLTKSKSDSVVLRQPSNTAVGQLTDLGQASTSLADISSSPSQSSSSSSSLSSSLSNSTTSISGQGEQPDASTKEGEGSENTTNNEIQSDGESPSSSTSSSSVSSIGSEESLASSNSTPNLPAEAPPPLSSSSSAAASTTETHLETSEQTTSEAKDQLGATTEHQEHQEQQEQEQGQEQAVAVPSSNASQPQTGTRTGVGSDEGATRCTLLLRGVADYERAMILPADAWFCEVRGILEGLAEVERRQQETLARRRELFLEQVLAERNYTNILYLVLSEFRTPLVNRRVVSPQQSAVLFDDLSRLQDEHLAVLPKMERLLIRWNEATAADGGGGGGGGGWRAEDGAAYVRLVEQLRRVFALAYPLYICYASTVQGLLEGLRDKSPIFVQFCAQLNKTHGREGALERLLRSPAEHLHGSLEVFARLLDCTPKEGEGGGGGEAEATRLLVETLTELDMAVHRQQDNATLLQSIHERIVQGLVQMRKAGLGSLAKVPFRVHLIESEVVWYHRAGSGSRAQNQWTHHHFFLLSDCLIAATVKESQPTSTRRDRKPQHAATTTTTTSDGDSSSSSSSSSSSVSSSSSQQQLKFKAAFPLRHLHPSTNESGSVPTITAPPTFPTGELWSKAAEVNPVLVRFYESPDEQDPAKARHLIFVLPTAASRRRWLDHLTQACHRIGHLVLSTEEKHRNREMLSTNEAWHPV